jgi:type II secretory pathway component PulJ
MEWVAIAILALILLVGVAVFAVFFQFREAMRQSRDLHEQILNEVDELGKKLDRLAAAPKPPSAPASGSA